MSGAPLIPCDDALRIVLSHCRPLPAVRVTLDAAPGGVLAEDLAAPHDQPRFAASAVDGYAVRSAETARAAAGQPVRLRVRGVARAGEAPVRGPRTGAMRVFTGAPVPAFADAVVMQEDVVLHGDVAYLERAVPAGANIRPAADEFREGERILAAGHLLDPAGIGLLATFGLTRVRIHRRPRVAVLATGDELRPASTRTLRGGEIRDANTPMLLAALRALGVEPLRAIRVTDHPARVDRALAEALENADVVLTSGGVSVGDHDYVRDALRRAGAVEHFWKVAMKPGKPLAFATRGRTLLFGLPGNPVAAILAFHLFVRPALLALQGRHAMPPFRCDAVLAAPLRKARGREEFVRVSLTRRDGMPPLAVPAAGQESHMLGGVTHADALYRFPADAVAIDAGTLVSVEPLHWSLP